ncbi:MAG: threonylcarbamoyl-AMP synthase [Desulfohalobiaceae bacterium]|nr:threonylcarbamoyl-AMP synthase [Desulfohalobiaceae bacterium]
MLAEAAKILRRGGVVIYPTETLFAIGCSVRYESAVRRVAACKGRGEAKPFPLIIGSREQLHQAAAGYGDDATRLMEAFWPGGLSLLLPARSDLPSGLISREGLISLRWTSHPDAQFLCRECGSPLVATSANTSGQPAVTRSEDLEPELTSLADGVVRRPCSDHSGQPSTMVRTLGGGRLRLIREGAISARRLRGEGFVLDTD